MRLAFAGFRHGHILGLYAAAKKHSNVQIVAAAEEDAATFETVKAAGNVQLTHRSIDEMLEKVACDAIAVGDYFSKRASIIMRALQSGKHVIADKPICTDLDELIQIRDLAAKTGLRIGCQLDLRDSGVFRTARRLIAEGKLGEVHTLIFTAQHPLNLPNRPKWYFEPNKHGGTINDIGVHAIDLIPWMTVREITEVTAARAWNARLKEFPHFQDAGQFLLKMDNDGGVFGDVSYLSPDGLAYSAPQYWRVTCHGDKGVLEARLGELAVSYASATDKSVVSVPADPDRPAGVLQDFLDEIGGKTIDGALTTADVLDASFRSLKIQQAADQQRFAVKLASD
jgi:predicted dehydrogenase